MSYTKVEYEPGELIFRQGDRGTMMFLIQDGKLEVLQELGGAETQIAVLERTEFFGEMSLLEDLPRTHTVRALSDAKLIQIDREGFVSMLMRNPDIGVRIVRKLSTRLAATQDMVMRAWSGAASLAAGSTTARVIAGNARLVHLKSDTEVVLPDRPEVSIGRRDPINQILPDVDLTNIDPQISTSRRHARIMRQADVFFIKEEKATNGTLVNEQRISSETPIEIRDGDLLTFGAVRMRFVVE